MTQAPILYLLPGLLCDRAIWANQIDALSKLGMDVRIPAFREFDSLGAMAQSVLTEAPERFALAGHSMGARVAIEIVRRAPERVERLALLDTGIHPRAEGEAEKRQLLVDLARAQGMTALAGRWLPPMLHPERVHDANLMTILTAMVERMSPEIFERQVKALLNRPDAEAALADIKCPVLIGVGRQDAWSPLSQHEGIARAIPHAKLVVYEESGHMAPLEAPAAVTASLSEWLGLSTAGRPAAATNIRIS